MQTASRPVRIGIVAGESSGDRLAAGAIEALRRRLPGVEVRGMAGPRMLAAGCRQDYSIEQLSVMGITEVIRRYGELRRLRREIIRDFLAEPPDVFIGVDAPDFVLTIERRLRSAGIKTVQLVSPTVWAWRSGRVRTVEKAANMVLSIFPFEAPYYEGIDIRHEYIGHPVADEIPLRIDRQTAKRALGLDLKRTTLLLLPGSRDQELRQCAACFLDAANRVAGQISDLEVVCAPLNDVHAGIIEQIRLQNVPDLELTVRAGQARDLLGAADVALITSGTSTIEALFSHCPSVVAYRVSNLSYRIMKSLVCTRYIAMANIIAGRQLFPEFVQDDMKAPEIAEALLEWLSDAPPQDFDSTCATMHAGMRLGAHERAAAAVADLLGESA